MMFNYLWLMLLIHQYQVLALMYGISGNHVLTGGIIYCYFLATTMLAWGIGIYLSILQEMTVIDELLRNVPAYKSLPLGPDGVICHLLYKSPQKHIYPITVLKANNFSNKIFLDPNSCVPARQVWIISPHKKAHNPCLRTLII